MWILYIVLFITTIGAGVGIGAIKCVLDKRRKNLQNKLKSMYNSQSYDDAYKIEMATEDDDCLTLIIIAVWSSCITSWIIAAGLAVGFLYTKFFGG